MSSLCALLVVMQGAWTFEAAPLVGPGFTPSEAKALSSTWVLSIGVRPGDATSTVFAAGPDAGVQQLGAWRSATFHEGPGSGLTLVTSNDAGVEVFGVRATPTPTLVSLGDFAKEPTAISCDEGVRECVLLHPEDEPMRWSAGTRSRLFTEPESAFEDAALKPAGLTIAPNGGWVGLQLQWNAALYELSTGRITLFRGNVTHTAKSVKELLFAVAKPPLSQKLDRAGETCNTQPTGWTNGRLAVEQVGNFDIGGPDCKYPSFSVDPRTLVRQPRKDESYPWTVYDCPNGGWGSAIGTLLTGCTTDVQRMMRGTMPLSPKRRSAAPIDPDDTGELSEALALSETELFIMAPARASSWDWFRRRPRFDMEGELLDKGAPVTLNGPSVVTLTAQGATVEALAWPYGKAIFETPLDDDWHLIKPTRQPPAMVRFIRR